MKKVTSILLSSLVCLTVGSQAALAAKSKHTVHRSAGGGGGGGGGGVMLQTPTPQTPIEHNNRGVELGSRGLWTDAINEHERALAAEPWNKEFRTNLSGAQLRYGNVLFRSGKFYEAIKQFRGALFVDPDNLPADEGLDECYKKLGKDPLNIAYRRAMAEDFEVKGQFEDAIVEYRKVLKMDDMGKSHADLGYTLMKAGKVVDGYQELRNAVQKQWKNDEVTDLAACHRKLAEVLTEFAYKARDRGSGAAGMKRLMNAATEYKRAVTLNPADAESIRGFIEVVRECTAMKPTFDNYLMLGGAYLLAHDFAHAKMAYEQCYKLDPRRPELAAARVAYHQAVARWPNASEELVAESVGKVQKFLESDPDNPRWWYIFGRLKQHQGDNDGAIEAYRRAEKINHLVDPDLEQQIKVLGQHPDLPGYSQVATSGGGGSQGGGGGGNGGQAGGGGGGQAPSTPAKPALDPRNMAAYAKVESMMSSNPDGALEILNGLLDRNPADGHAWLLKGGVLRKKGETDPSALDEASVALRTAAGFKEPEADDALREVNTIRVQTNIQRAEQYISEGNWIKASNELGDAIIKAPNLAVLHRKQADVMRHMNDNTAADRELKKAGDLEGKTK